jgi:hypothetical protein
MKPRLSMQIAGIRVRISSPASPRLLTGEDADREAAARYLRFRSKQAAQDPDIDLEVRLVTRQPAFKGKNLFRNIHFQSGLNNWQLLRSRSGYVFKSRIRNKNHLIRIADDFSTATDFIKSEKSRLSTNSRTRKTTRTPVPFDWQPSDVIYDFLQILMINYLAARNSGIFCHSLGVKAPDGSGLLFTGRSGAGKSTSARIWHRHSGTLVLNDDRMIIRKVRGRFLIYSCPWHGEFSAYFDSAPVSAPLKKIFFIFHARKNVVEKVPPARALGLLYPTVFLPFWEKKCLENASRMAQELVQEVPCYSLGFVNDQEVIDFVEKIK